MAGEGRYNLAKGGCCELCCDRQDAPQKTRLFCIHEGYCARLAAWLAKDTGAAPEAEELTNEDPTKDMNTASQEFPQEGISKRCPRCGRVLPLDAFALKKNAKDGRQVYCRECTAAMNRENYKRKHAAKAAVIPPAPASEETTAELQIAEMEAELERKPLALIDVFADKELVAELRRRGYEVTAHKVMTVEL